jgi:hypothetical protein
MILHPKLAAGADCVTIWALQAPKLKMLLYIKQQKPLSDTVDDIQKQYQGHHYEQNVKQTGKLGKCYNATSKSYKLVGNLGHSIHS